MLCHPEPHPAVNYALRNVKSPFGMGAALTQLHTHANFLPEDVLKQISSKIAFYNPKSPAAAVQIAEADTEIREAAERAVEEHLDELAEFVSTTTGHGLPEWKELKPSQKWSFAGATVAALINTLEAGLTASNGEIMAAQMVSGLVIYLFFIAHLEAEVQENRGVVAAEQESNVPSTSQSLR